MTLKNISYALFIIIASVFILVVSKSYMIPLVIALLFWFLIKGIRTGLMKIPFIGEKLPRWVWTITAVIILAAVYVIIIELIVSNLKGLQANIDVYKANAMSFTGSIQEQLNVDIEQYIPEFMNNSDLGTLLTSALGSVSSMLSNIFMIILYIMFMLGEELNFKSKLTAIIPDEERRIGLLKVLAEIDKSTMSFLGLKTLIGLMTGAASYIVLLILGVDAALFWAFLIFLFNYIPFIGSVIATVFPAIFAVFQFGDVYHPLAVFVFIEIIQLVVGNIIEPKMMGKSLNLSSLVVIIALTFWSAMWGMTGALLSIPLTVIMVIVFKQFKSTLPIAQMLSEKGKV